MTSPNVSVDIFEFLNRKATVNFLQAARQFVALLEKTDIEMSVFLRKAHSCLIELYLAGYMLDQIPLNYSDADSDFDRAELFSDRNAQMIAELGDNAFYWEIYDPTFRETDNGEPGPGWTKSDKEPSLGWIVDDFSDIYKDVKIELNKIDIIGTNEAVEDALWQFKWSFLNHWGLHCVNAMRYLHFYCYEGKHVM